MGEVSSSVFREIGEGVCSLGSSGAGGSISSDHSCCCSTQASLRPSLGGMAIPCACSWAALRSASRCSFCISISVFNFFKLSKVEIPRSADPMKNNGVDVAPK